MKIDVLLLMTIGSRSVFGEAGDICIICVLSSSSVFSQSILGNDLYTRLMTVWLLVVGVS